MTLKEEEQGYRQEGQWRGHIQYKCNFCPYDDLNEVRIRDHVIQRHQLQLIKTQTVPVTVPLFDASGKQVTEMEVPVREGEDDAED